MSTKDSIIVGGLALVAAYLLYKKAQDAIGAPVKNFTSWVAGAPQTDDPSTTDVDESKSLLASLGFKPFEDNPDTPDVDESKLGFWAYLKYAVERFFSMAGTREEYGTDQPDCGGDIC